MPNPVLRRFFVAAIDREVAVWLIACLIAAAASAVFAAAGPIALKVLVDGLADGEGRSVALAAAAAYVAALGLQRLVEQGQAFAFGIGEQRLQQRLNAALFAHVLTLPMSFHVDRQGGALMQTVTLGLQGARIIVTHVIFSILPVLVQALLIAVVVAALFDAQLWLTVAGALAAYAVVFFYSVKRLTAPTQAVSAATVNAGGALADTLANVEPVKAFSAEANMNSRYRQMLDEAQRRWRDFYLRRLENGVAAAIVFTLALVAVLIQAVFAFTAGRISIGDFVLLNTYLLQIVRPLEMVGFALRDVAQGAIYLEKWRELLAMPAEMAAPAARPSPLAAETAPSISFTDVSFAYRPDQPVLDKVSFSIPAGGTLAVVGPSGAGKSSLARLLSRYYEPVGGEILINGAPARELSIERLRAMIGVVAQDTVLFNSSLRYNISFADPDASEEALTRAIEIAHLDKLVARLPEGLDTLVGERGLKLSGGERQRVAIARAALKQAPLLVLDEATSALDLETERAICRDLVEAMEGRTTLIVTHRLALARRADAILVLDRGVVVERGDHDALVAAGGAYAELWRLQADPADAVRPMQAAG